MILDRLNSTVLMGVESAINQALKYDPATQKTIAKLEGKVVAVESTLPPQKFFIIHCDDGISLLGQYEGEPDTSLKGTALSLATLAVVGQEQVSFFATGVEVTGSQELLREVREILMKLDVDWEAILAKLIGDVPAHLLSKTLRTVAGWQKDAGERMGDVLMGFNQEELQLIPSRTEADHFFGEVRKVTQSVDRIAARIDQLVMRQQTGER